MPSQIEKGIVATCAPDGSRPRITAAQKTGHQALGGTLNSNVLIRREIMFLR